MPYSEAAKRATIKYQKENLEQLVIRLKKGDRQRIKDHVALMKEITGENMTEFLRRAIFDTMEKDRDQIKAKLSER